MNRNRSCGIIPALNQDKAHIREVRQLNQRLEEMSDQKTVLLWLMASHGLSLWAFGSEGLHGRRSGQLWAHGAVKGPLSQVPEAGT